MSELIFSENDKPFFLKNDFFKTVLSNGYSIYNVNIKSVSITNGSSGGENYCSKIFRALISYSYYEHDRDDCKNVNEINTETSLIVKCLISDTSGSEIIEELDMFKKEVKMYFDIIPNIVRLFKEEGFTLAPRCLQAINEPSQILVIEDLVKLGYSLADRTVGLDEQHSRKVLEKIAKMHAGSMVLAEKKPEYLKLLVHGILKPSRRRQSRRSSYITNFQKLSKILSDQQGYESIAQKLLKISEHFFDIAYDNVLTTHDKIKVINHGDLWVNNFMFKCNNDKEISDVVFIDLQLSVYGSLGLDINYLLNTSIQLDVLKTKRDELLRHYYDTLLTSLKLLNYKPLPSWDDVQNEIDRKEFFGLFAFAVIFPIISMDKENSQDNSLQTLTNQETREKKLDIVFNTPRFRETAKYALKRLDDLGILDRSLNYNRIQTNVNERE